MITSNPQPQFPENPQPKSAENPQPKFSENPQILLRSSSVEYRVVIAYDFGTTYSGAAYAFNHSSPIEVFDVQNWPHKGSNFYPKVPTLSVYPRRTTRQQGIIAFNGSPISEWGYAAKKVMMRPDASEQNILLSQFKLQLDESLELPPLENGLTPVQAMADYLAKLHKHTLQELSRGFANNYHPDTFRYCLTVPAVWSDKAKHMMRQAAIQAGLITPFDPSERLTLISEPEAAAIYCEEAMVNQVKLRDNDRVMVCDAGGGTVDLTVFQVNFISGPKSAGSNNNVASNKRQLKEVTKGIGASCGSVFLDERFHRLLKAKLGQKVMSNLNQRDLSTILGYFIDTIKPDFNEEDDYFLELPRSIEVDDLPVYVREHDDGGFLDDGIMKLSGREIQKEVFDPVVDKVLALIEQQYQQIPDGQLHFLFLVGGFGSSKYLYERIRKEFEGTKVKYIACPAERAALAVVRGATYFGVNPRAIISRVSRRTYGTNTAMLYESKIDPPSKRVVRPDGSVRCKGRFDPFIKKNEKVQFDHCISKDFFVYYGSQKTIKLNLYATENDQTPRYCDEPGVYQIATILITVPDIPKMKKNKHLGYIVRMFFGRTEIRMEAKFKNGETYEINCNFDTENNYS
ncbi:hypothetical protein BDA99DRAFT_534383 [Phascolomyces articulosus]|uniref:Uncharacterized protein n=1 Tax=Phascolomyces articulosus TaxID=60185 RepID=A0AAD5PHQ7_9FUNG|nr:hypothetical protein BDA99DRAFT_534383 [Phascolomyces articulosus]